MLLKQQWPCTRSSKHLRTCCAHTASSSIYPDAWPTSQRKEAYTLEKELRPMNWWIHFLNIMVVWVSKPAFAICTTGLRPVAYVMGTRLWVHNVIICIWFENAFKIATSGRLYHDSSFKLVILLNCCTPTVVNGSTSVWDRVLHCQQRISCSEASVHMHHLALLLWLLVKCTLLLL